MTYIKNIEQFNEMFGTDYSGEEIGYGEKAFIFQDVTDSCDGKDDDEKFVDFGENADFGTAFWDGEKYICKARVEDDIILIYEDSDGNIHRY